MTDVGSVIFFVAILCFVGIVRFFYPEKVKGKSDQVLFGAAFVWLGTYVLLTRSWYSLKYSYQFDLGPYHQIFGILIIVYGGLWIFILF
jgi:hypothetical protein